MTTLGLALITKDEQDTLPNLLASVGGVFDQVVLADTGSSDETVERFREWALAEQASRPEFRFTIETFDWIDDFAAARTFAHEMLDTDWECWADADDVIRGAQHLRRMAELAAPDIGGFVASYDYAQDGGGNCVCRLRRERLIRAGLATWHGRVHEAQTVEGQMQYVEADVVEWVHRKPPAPGPSDRNLKILRDWVKDEPENPRVLGYLGTEYTFRGEHKKALTWYRRYLKTGADWDEERAQVYRKLGMSLIALDRPQEAIKHAFEAMQLLPSWPDSYLTLAEAHYNTHQHDRAMQWAEEVIRRGVPETLLIINPLDYAVSPRVILALSLAAVGQTERAVDVANEVLSVVPDHPLLQEPYRQWRETGKREHTAETVVSLAQALIAHDEQLKALEVLRNAPYYAIDHPQVVGLRSALRERLAPILTPEEYAGYYEDAAKPEDFVPDDHVMATGDQLPRCAFLLRGVNELAEAAA